HETRDVTTGSNRAPRHQYAHELTLEDHEALLLTRGVENEVLSSSRYNRFKAGHPSGYIEAFANLYHDIADALLDYKSTGRWDNPHVFGLEHSVSGLAVLEAAVASHYQRQWVHVQNTAADQLPHTDAALLCSEAA
ncbi:MAG: hypothetical protein AAF404_12305, partial [Pseudomonadota bacterium]